MYISNNIYYAKYYSVGEGEMANWEKNQILKKIKKGKGK